MESRKAVLLVVVMFALLVLCGCPEGSGNGGSPQPTPTPNPIPSITGLSPSSVTAGAGETALTISGTGFASQGAVAQMDGSALSTTFVSATQLQVIVPATALSIGQKHLITVTNPSPGGGTSASVGPFRPAGNMTSGRAFHTQTLLSNGKVLVAGGGWFQGLLHNVLASAELYDPDTRTFNTTGSMTASREGHTATLLPNGKVLVAGGFSNENGVVASAELYDPAAGAFTATGNMTTPREYHVAVLLTNGKVLIAGGDDGSNSMASTELYDPATGVFRATASMSVARVGHTATALADGKVLIVGSGTDADIAELYDPSSGTFFVTGSLQMGRGYHTAVLLNNGKVLIAGGYSSHLGGALTEAELFDPATGMFTQTGNLGTPRYLHAAVALGDGKVLELGGADASVTLASVEIYDPVSGTFSATWTMAQSRYYATATVLSDGSVLVAGGDNGQQGPNSAIREAETLPSPLAAAVTNSARFTVNNPVPMIASLSATTVPTASKVTITGANFDVASDVLLNGVAVPSYVDLAFSDQIYFYPSLAGFYQVSVINAAPGGGISNVVGLTVTVSVRISPAFALWAPGSTNQLTATVSGTSDTSVTWTVEEGPAGGSVDSNGLYTAPQAPGTYHVVATSGADPSQSAVARILVGPGAGQMSATGRTTAVRMYHTATLLADGKVLIAGGLDQASGQGLASAELYDPNTGRFTPTGSMAGGRVHGSAIRLRDSRVLISGGGSDITSLHPLANAEIYNPETGTFTVTGNDAGGATILLPDGRVFFDCDGDPEIYDPATGMFSITGKMVVPRNGCMAVLLPSGKVLIAGGAVSGNWPPLDSAELYDPATGTFSTTGRMTEPRINYYPLHNPAVLLGNGRVLLFSGMVAGAGLGSAEIYDPAAGTFRATASLPVYPNQSYAPVVLLQNGLAFIPGGRMVTGFTAGGTHRTEFYDPATNAFYAGPLTGAFHGDASTATVLANGSALMVGDGDTADLYTPPPYDPISALAKPSEERAGSLSGLRIAVAPPGAARTAVGRSAEPVQRLLDPTGAEDIPKAPVPLPPKIRRTSPAWNLGVQPLPVRRTAGSR